MKLITFATIAMTIAVAVGFLFVGCGSHRAQHCGEIISSEQLHGDFGPVADIAIKGDDGIIWQERAQGLWNTGMRTCK